MRPRTLPAAVCTAALGLLGAVAPLHAQRVSKDVPAAPAQQPAAPTSPTGGAVMTPPPAGSATPAAGGTSAATPTTMTPLGDSVTAAPGSAAPGAPSALPYGAGMGMNTGPNSLAAGQAGAAGMAPPRAPSPAGGETPEEMYTDPKILAVASQSNFNEIEPSQVALERATRPDVRALAQMMIDVHTRLEASARAMAQRKGLVPVDNALSLQLKRNGPPTLEMLRMKRGADFDAAYVLQQIQSHDLTLKTLDTSLIPAARDPELKTMLRDTVRPHVVDHLNRIMAIHHAMMGMQPPATPAR